MAQDQPKRRGALTPTGGNSPAAVRGYGSSYASRLTDARFFGGPTDDYVAPPPSGGPSVDEASSTGATFSTTGSYRVATFTGAGTLVVDGGGSFEYLLVAGGGGGVVWWLAGCRWVPHPSFFL